MIGTSKRRGRSKECDLSASYFEGRAQTSREQNRPPKRAGQERCVWATATDFPVRRGLPSPRNEPPGNPAVGMTGGSRYV